jgi:hypothetical protein
MARNTVVKPITDPTERSIPPEMMTKVMPTATMPRKALSVRRLATTRVDAKFGNCSEQSMNPTTKTAVVTRTGSRRRIRSSPSC